MGEGCDEVPCPACGEPVAAASSTCAHCGAVLDGSGGSSQSGSDGSGVGASSLDGASTFDFALRYPFTREWDPIAIGAVLSLLGAFVLPTFVLNGYAVRVGRAAARGDDDVPEYGDWGELLVDGLLYFLATLPYAIVATGLAFVLFVAVVAVGDAGGVALALLAVPGFLLLGYVGGAIVPTLVATGSVRDTYADLRFVRVALSREYLTGFLILVAMQVAAAVVVLVAAVLLILTVVGVPIAFVGLLAAQAYLQYVTWALWGRVCRSAGEDSPLHPTGRVAGLDVEL